MGLVKRSWAKPTKPEDAPPAELLALADSIAERLDAICQEVRDAGGVISVHVHWDY